MDQIEALLKKQCYIIDILPKKVPADSKGSFFDVEAYFSDHNRQYAFQNKFTAIILKLMCYYPIAVFSYDNYRLIRYPSPQTVVVLKNQLRIILRGESLCRVINRLDDGYFIFQLFSNFRNCFVLFQTWLIKCVAFPSTFPSILPSALLLLNFSVNLTQLIVVSGSVFTISTILCTSLNSLFAVFIYQ